MLWLDSIRLMGASSAMLAVLGIMLRAPWVYRGIDVVIPLTVAAGSIVPVRMGRASLPCTFGIRRTPLELTA